MMRVFFLGLSFIVIRTEAFTVLGAAMPLVAQAGGSVTLPCSIDTPLPTLDLEVQWIREDSGSIVHMFQEGGSRPESQSPSYRGRAEFFSEEISKGNYSLLLINVTTEDKGLYKCVVFTDQESRETLVKINIERLVVTGAVKPVFAYSGEDVILNCTVDTDVPVGELQVQWIKINGEILVLLFDEGESRPESQDERFRGRTEFFSEEIPKGNFSMKLRDVKTEDQGEFMCKIDGGNRKSVNATAWLQEQGFSSLYICILGLTFAAAVFAVLSCIPAVLCIKRERKGKGKRNRAGWLYFLQVSVPCILLSIAFIIWGIVDSSVGEAFICSAVNLLRILVIFRVAPYRLPGKYFERFTKRALPLEILILTTGINLVLFHRVIHRGAAAEIQLLTGIFFGFVLLYGFLGVIKSRLYPVFSFGFRSQDVIGFQVFFLILTRSIFSFGIGMSRVCCIPESLCPTMLFPTHEPVRSAEYNVGDVNAISGRGGGLDLNCLRTLRQEQFAVFLVWFIVPVVIEAMEDTKHALSQNRYLLGQLFDGFQFLLECAFYLLFLHFILEKDGDHPGFMCFMAFLFVLKAIMRFNHRSDLPVVPHILVYASCSAGLSVLNSVALATEVFLKAEKGQRTVEDLRVVILLLESVFFACWLGLQIYAYCNRNAILKIQLELLVQCCKKQDQPPKSQQNQPADEVEELPDIIIRLKAVEKQLQEVLERMPKQAVEVEPHSPPTQRTAHRQETPAGAAEMEPLSGPAQVN
ncbi:hypothetical protein GJAV_G00048660 [Gymnothorax javanicus]|nr:hypothetical protein GJAV_G00048660 [Gymnothorax javanicus]